MDKLAEIVEESSVETFFLFFFEWMNSNWLRFAVCYLGWYFLWTAKKIVVLWQLIKWNIFTVVELCKLQEIAKNDRALVISQVFKWKQLKVFTVIMRLTIKGACFEIVLSLLLRQPTNRVNDLKTTDSESSQFLQNW